MVQFLDGKIPCSAITKFRVRYGAMLVCGCDQPFAETVVGLIAESAEVAYGFALVAAM